MRYIYNGKPLYHSVEGLQHLEPTPEQVELDKHKYGLPKLKKYPMPDAAHVKSAIKFFNYVSPKDEKTLANAILNRMREYGITGIKVGEGNRFSKYYHPDSLQHSSGIWQEHDYQDKIELPDGSFRYVYPDTDTSAIGSRLNGSAGQNTTNAPKYNQGVALSKEQHNKSVQQQKRMHDALSIPMSQVGKYNAPKYNQGIVGTDKKKTTNDSDASGNIDSEETKSTKKGKSGGSGKKGSGSKKSGSGKSGSGKSSAGKASGGKSAKTGSGKSGTSGKSGDDSASKKAAKEAKKQQKAQKDYQKELQKIREENKKKQDEQFEQRRRENEKRWKAEEERMEKMRDTSRQSVSKETLSEIIEMLKGSDKEYAKKLLEGGRSKIDDYLDWLKESRKNNSK